jgi:hypothetical protein
MEVTRLGTKNVYLLLFRAKGRRETLTWKENYSEVWVKVPHKISKKEQFSVAHTYRQIF